MKGLIRVLLAVLAVLGGVALTVGMYGVVTGNRHNTPLIGVGGSLLAVWSLLSQRLARKTPDAR